MEIGMLWIDNDPDTELAQKVNQAAAYYNSKYGVVPDLCFIHPSALDDDGQPNGSNLEIRSSQYIRPHHFWIGRERKSDE
jgi:hypothetical protein